MGGVEPERGLRIIVPAPDDPAKVSHRFETVPEKSAGGLNAFRLHLCGSKATDFVGALATDRTPDLLITKQPLYQLSYKGAELCITA